jgi:hypothetical protein
MNFWKSLKVGVSVWLLMFSLSVFSAESFDEQHSVLIRKNPEKLSLIISVEKNTYQIGEVIPITLTYSNNSEIDYVVDTRNYDRSGRIDDMVFKVEGPSGGFCDPLTTHLRGIGGGLGGYEPIGKCSQVFDLNEWVRFDKPGNYRIYCTAYRVRKKNDWNSISLCSQIMDLKIVHSDKAFIKKTMDDALVNLKSEDEGVRYKAVRMLRFLATSEAVDALVPLIGDPSIGVEAVLGIIGSRDRWHAKKVLYKHMKDPDIVVDFKYIDALATVSLPAEEWLIDWDSSDSEKSMKLARAVYEKRENTRKEILKKFSDVIMKKRDRVLAVGCKLLLKSQVDTPILRQKLAESFLYLTKREQEELLEFRWEQIKCAEFEPVLKKILEGPWEREDWRFAGITSLALLRYQEYKPEEARALIIEDIKRSDPFLSGRVLASLPDESLPQIENLLISHLKGKSDLEKVIRLIERYATKNVLPEIIKFYQEGEGFPWNCPYKEGILRCWIKYDRENGIAAVMKAMNMREHQRCYISLLGGVFSDYYGSDVEKVVISFLSDEELNVVMDSVRLLAKKGTSDCIYPLLKRLETLDPNKKERSPQETFAEEFIYREIVDSLLNNDRWELTKEQQELFKKYLQTERERQKYIKRFEIKQEEID